MSSKFGTSPPPRKTPAVCFPPRPSPPLDPKLWPPTLLARFFTISEPPAEPATLDFITITLVKDPDYPIWTAESDIEDAYIWVHLLFDPESGETWITYLRKTPDYPDVDHAWYNTQVDALLPYSQTLPKQLGYLDRETTWGSITA